MILMRRKMEEYEALGQEIEQLQREHESGRGES